MRMWKVDPSKMCRKHLLGEHVEMHMFVGSINKGIGLDGYISKGLVEVHNIKDRHSELSLEMERRGWHHQSPLIEFTEWKAGRVSIRDNEIELGRRCLECKFNQPNSIEGRSPKMKLNQDVLKGITLEQVKAAIAEINNDPKIQKAGEKVRGKRHANKAVLAECLVDGVLRLADKGFKIPEKVDDLTASLMELPLGGGSDKEITEIPTKPWAWQKVKQTPEVQKRIDKPIDLNDHSDAEKAVAKAHEKGIKGLKKPPKLKTPKVPPIVQNGVRKPKPEGKCGQAWAIFDSLQEKNGEVIIGDALTWAAEGGLNPGNVRTEFTYWKKFHGITKTK